MAVQTCLAIGLDRLAFYTNALAYWVPRGEYMGNIMPRQAIAMTFDFAECVPLSESTGGFHGAIQWVQRVCEANVSAHLVPGQVSRGSATDNPLPDNSCSALITDPLLLLSTIFRLVRFLLCVATPFNWGSVS